MFRFVKNLHHKTLHPVLGLSSDYQEVVTQYGGRDCRLKVNLYDQSYPVEWGEVIGDLVEGSVRVDSPLGFVEYHLDYSSYPQLKVSKNLDYSIKIEDPEMKPTEDQETLD